MTVLEEETGFGQLVASCLDLKWHTDPVEATGAGLSQYDHLLGSYSVDSIERNLAAFQSLAAALEELSAESLDDEVDRTALLNDVRVTIHRFERERPHVHNPGFWLNHALDGLYLLSVARDRSEEHRTWAAESRLKALPGLLESAKGTLGECPAVFVETGIQLAAAGLSLIDDVAQELGDASVDLITARHDARTALQDFRDHLESLMADAPEEGFAIGEDAFNFRLHFEHALPMTASELWRRGNSMVDEAEYALQTAASDISPGEPWQDVVDQLRKDHPERERLVETYGVETERALRFVEDNDLVPVPEGLLDVVETPGFLRPLIPFAAYLPPGAFSQDRTGLFYVTPPDAKADPDAVERMLREHCKHEIPCTVVHEGYPGHHVQFLSAQAGSRVVRKIIGTPVTIEGWALYCEEMMDEAGFYRTPDERLFRRLAMLWRAVRVVLDVGLHTRGMSVGEAVDTLVDRVHFEPAQALAEVRRYCAHPAYQLCYAIGLQEIMALRESYRAAMGAKFTLRRFHEAVLGYGGLPVSVIRWGLGIGD
jgi:hypothetical protein